MINNIISRAFGSFASIKFPKTIQNIINKSYAKMFGIDFSEFRDCCEY